MPPMPRLSARGMVPPTVNCSTLEDEGARNCIHSALADLVALPWCRGEGRAEASVVTTDVFDALA